ncbi:MAG: hypothetical protein IKO78_05535 [Bacilli bacterium]|nr:hypothetical protein [Bacilli bacterium]
MNNQMPYGFMPNFMPGMNDDRELRMMNERIDRIEKQVKKLEKKISMLEGNFPQPYNPNFSGMSNNYSI